MHILMNRSNWVNLINNKVYIAIRDPPSAKKKSRYCDTASCVKVDNFNPKCNQLGCMKPLRQKLTLPIANATSLVAFRIEGVNIETTGFI